MMVCRRFTGSSAGWTGWVGRNSRTHAPARGLHHGGFHHLTVEAVETMRKPSHNSVRGCPHCKGRLACMGRDEAGTLARLKNHRRLDIEPALA
jgi:hypothetical protein